MATVRKTVTVPGDNSQTVLDLLDILKLCPCDAKIRTVRQPGDPIITIWWDEEL